MQLSIERTPTTKKFSLPRGAGLWIAVIVLVVASSLISPHFLNPTNLLNVLRQVALYGILGVGMTFVILTRGIDLSVGSIVAFSGVLGATLMEKGLPIPVTVVCSLAAGTLIGVVNGLGVAVWRVPAFIMTLGTMVMTRGFGLMVADGGTVNPGKAAESFFWLGGGYLMGVPTPIYVFAAVCLVAYVILSHTTFGRAIFAVGSNELKASFNLVGGTVSGSATWRVVSAGPHQIELQLVSSNGLPNSLLGKANDIKIPLNSLPAGLTLTGKLSSSSGGIVAHVSAQSLSFGS